MRVQLLLLTACAIMATDASTAPPHNTTGHHLNQVLDPDALSEPIILCNPLSNNVMHVTCFSASGALPIVYKLFLNHRMLPEMTVLKSEPANFTIVMTPGTQISLICTATSATGQTLSSSVTLSVHKDDFAAAADETEADHKDKDTGPEHLIPLQHILTSVTPGVLEFNTILLITCGSIILLLLVIVIVFTYLRGKREEHMEA